MLLKPRLAHNIAAILGGIFISFIGFISAVGIGSYASIVAAVVGILGLSWIFMGTLGLIRRSRLVITIDGSGIGLPFGSLFRGDLRNFLVPQEIIAGIDKHKSLKDRVVMVSLKTGDRIPVHARNYCEIKDFLSLCERAGLPVI